MVQSQQVGSQSQPNQIPYFINTQGGNVHLQVRNQDGYKIKFASKQNLARELAQNHLRSPKNKQRSEQHSAYSIVPSTQKTDSGKICKLPVIQPDQQHQTLSL